MFDNWEIGRERRHIIVRDGASNIVGASQEVQVPSIHCMIHLVQLTVKDSLFEQRVVIDLITKCRKLCGHLSHSPVAVNKFLELQTGEKLKLFKISPQDGTQLFKCYSVSSD
jgi:hypothetical protein